MGILNNKLGGFFNISLSVVEDILVKSLHCAQDVRSFQAQSMFS